MKLISAVAGLLVPTISAKAADTCKLVSSYCRDGMCCYVYQCRRSDGSIYHRKTCIPQ
ncbi:hypothetical protein ACBI99_26330 [Nonomuraea sp. ATR24]|uniref:hypothetical protein n=1 Tax=Nonomuraea TaxID=83681 RepID=UPI001C606ED6|nr:hypothetical protein [Nonomuraea ceibae]